MKIYINEPCHENWDSMKPNEKGAFCLSCQKNVVDFSKKTIDEVKSFFTDLQSSEKVCGRFEKDQLTELSFDDFFEQFRSWNFLRKAVIVVFFVFGFSLFSCAPKGSDVPLMGAVAIQDTVKPICIDPKEENILKGEVAIKDTVLGEPIMVKGKVKKN